MRTTHIVSLVSLLISAVLAGGYFMFSFDASSMSPSTGMASKIVTQPQIQPEALTTTTSSSTDFGIIVTAIVIIALAALAILKYKNIALKSAQKQSQP